jgi:hypothetical protein
MKSGEFEKINPIQGLVNMIPPRPG